MRRAIFLLYLFLQFLPSEMEEKVLVTVVTVATNPKHFGYKRFLESAKKNNINVRNIGEGKPWNNTITKLQLLRQFLEPLDIDNRENDIIVATDGYDVVFLSNLHEIVSRFYKFRNTKVLFSAETLCAPDPSLAKKYSKKDLTTVYPYLNSGGIIGYLPELKKIVNDKTYAGASINSRYRDQLFYTLVYLNKTLRNTYGISLDHNANVFLNLNGSKQQVKVYYSEKGYFLEDIMKNLPPIIHAPGKGKRILDDLYGKYF